MTLTQTALVISALLLTPGPTNTQVAVAAAERGFLRALRLVPAELAGYMAAVLPLLWAGPWLMERVPGAAQVITAAAALWVAVLAARLWQLPGPGAVPTVTASRVALTTFLNPKTLVFGLVILPGPDAALRLGLFAGLIVAVAALWAGIGSGVQGVTGRAAWIRRAAALWLAALSAMLAARALAG